MTLIFRGPQRVLHGNSRDSFEGQASWDKRRKSGIAVNKGGEAAYAGPRVRGRAPTTGSTECAQRSDLHVPRYMFIPFYHFLNNYFHKLVPVFILGSGAILYSTDIP